LVGTKYLSSLFIDLKIMKKKVKTKTTLKKYLRYLVGPHTSRVADWVQIEIED